MPLPYRDRVEAGEELGRALLRVGLVRPLVLGVPRGGVAVAVPVAAAIRGDLDVIVVRKIGAPRNHELGLGAVGPSGEPWLDERMVEALGVPERHLRKEIQRQQAEAKRRLLEYRGTDTPADVRGREVVVVDDGIATGATVIAAAQLLRQGRPKRLVLAVPVAPIQGVIKAQDVYDDVVAAETPEPYYAVGQWYRDFHQVTDDEVRALLTRAAPT